MSRARRGTGDERGATDPCLRSGPANVKARCSPERVKRASEDEGDFRRQATPARRLKAERSDGLCENESGKRDERKTKCYGKSDCYAGDKKPRLGGFSCGRVSCGGTDRVCLLVYGYVHDEH